MPYCAAIWRAFCSSVSRQVFLEREGCFPEACFLKACSLETCGFVVAGDAAAGVAAATGASFSAGTRSIRSAAYAETEARANAAMRTNLRT